MEDIKYLISCYGFIVIGLGPMDGKTFSDYIKRVYDCTLPLNTFFINLAEKRITFIEVSPNGIAKIVYRTN